MAATAGLCRSQACCVYARGVPHSTSACQHHAAGACLHGEGADNHLAAAEAQRLVRLGALGRRRRRKRVLAADTVTVDELQGATGTATCQYVSTVLQLTNALTALTGQECMVLQTGSVIALRQQPRNTKSMHNACTTLQSHNRLYPTPAGSACSACSSTARLGDAEHDGPAVQRGRAGGGQEDATNKHEGRAGHRAPLAPDLVRDEAERQHTQHDTHDLRRQGTAFSTGNHTESARESTPELHSFPALARPRYQTRPAWTCCSRQS